MIDELAFRYLGGFVKPFLKNFDQLKETLVKAGIKTSLHEYVARIFFLSILTFVVSMPALSLTMGVVFGYAKISSVALVFTFAFLLSLLLTGGAFVALFYYPSLMSNSRKRKLDNALPFGAVYMSAIASSGSSPAQMFRIISGFGEFGELSKEAQKVYTDTEVFGMDLKTALQKCAERSPSENFKELLWGLITVLTTGGNMSNFLREKSRGFMAEYRRKLNEYSQQLSLYIEMYITLIIVGSVFFLILSAVMSAISTSTMIVAVQFFVIFFFLPLVSLGFIVVIKGLSPDEG